MRIENIGELLVPTTKGAPIANDSSLRALNGAFLRIEGDRIAEVGALSKADAPSTQDAPVIDARGGAVIPGLVDSHTHLVFAGTREDEFVMRSAGKSYLEIARAGGGIARTVAAVRQASVAELVELARPRLERMLSRGVTTVEIKSGYGLSVVDEIKMLEVVRELDGLQPIELVPTYLAAHTVPPEFRERRDEYVELVVSDALMGYVAREGLAEFCDVFCEASAFTVAESRHILERGKEHGLSPKIHADQITQMGASRLAAEVSAVSAEHLEHIDDASLQALRESGVIAGVIPGCSFYLGVPQAPARRLIEAGIPVSVATDYNPGSSVIESLPLVLSIACTQAKMTPHEALVGASVNAAAALERGDRLGRLEAGMQADVTILDVPSVDQWLYEVGREAVRTVIKSGVVVYERAPK